MADSPTTAPPAADSDTGPSSLGGGALRLALGAALAAVLLAVLVQRVQAAHGAPLRADVALHRWTLEHRQGWLTRLAIGVTTSGTGPVAYLLAAVGGVLYRARARWWVAGVAAVAGLAAAQVLRVSLATAIGRHRPPVADWAWHAGGPALPSGHTTTSALVAALLVAALLRRRPGPSGRLAAALAVAWAVAVGASRVYLGVHWPTDVLAGWLFALTVVLAVTAAVAVRSRRPAHS